MNDEREPYRSRIGENFDLEMEMIRERTRSWIAKTIFGIGSLVLLFAAVFSVIHSDFNPVTISVLTISPFWWAVFRRDIPKE